MNHIKFLVTLSAFLFMLMLVPGVHAVNVSSIEHVDLYDTGGTLLGTYSNNYGELTVNSTVSKFIGANWHVHITCDQNVTVQYQLAVRDIAASASQWGTGLLGYSNVTSMNLTANSYQFDWGADPANFPTGYVGYSDPGMEPISMTLVVNVYDNNGTNLLLSQSWSSVAIVTQDTLEAAQSDWIYAIIMILLVFIPAWILNSLIPRYGLIVGLSLMGVVLGMSTPDFLWVTFIMLFGSAIMVYSMESV